MTSFRQIEANRRNARLSTGPVTEEGKRKSRQNALRHGLTAETVIDALEDAEDYAAFEMALAADYDAQSAVERELVLVVRHGATAPSTKMVPSGGARMLSRRSGVIVALASSEAAIATRLM
jgi:hypothetical protein